MTERTHDPATDDGVTGKIDFAQEGILCGPAGDYIVCLEGGGISISHGPNGPRMFAMPEDDDLDELYRLATSGALRLRARHAPLLEGWDEFHLLSENDPARYYVINFETGDEYGTGDWEQPE